MSFDPWTVAMEQDLLRMRRGPDKVPFSTIAKTLSTRYPVYVTKNACIGKARRLGALDTKGPRPVKRPPPPKPAAVPRSAGHEARVSVAITPLEFAAPADRSKGVTIYQLNHTTSRWPLWKDPNAAVKIYCGDYIKGDGVYCKHHHAVSYHKTRAA